MIDKQDQINWFIENGKTEEEAREIVNKMHSNTKPDAKQCNLDDEECLNCGS